MIKNEGELSDRAVALILFIIILVGTVLRFIGLGFQSLWYDELHSIIPTAPENSIASIIEYCKGDQPPAFFLYLHFFFKSFGYSEVLGRAAVALTGVISIPVCYQLGKEFNNKKTGLMAAFARFSQLFSHSLFPGAAFLCHDVPLFSFILLIFYPCLQNTGN